MSRLDDEAELHDGPLGWVGEEGLLGEELLEDKRLEDERLEDERLEDERLEDERLEDERLEDESLEDESLEEQESLGDESPEREVWGEGRDRKRSHSRVIAALLLAATVAALSLLLAGCLRSIHEPPTGSTPSVSAQGAVVTSVPSGAGMSHSFVAERRARRSSAPHLPRRPWLASEVLSEQTRQPQATSALPWAASVPRSGASWGSAAPQVGTAAWPWNAYRPAGPGDSARLEREFGFER